MSPSAQHISNDIIRPLARCSLSLSLPRESVELGVCIGNITTRLDFSASSSLSSSALGKNVKIRNFPTHIEQLMALAFSMVLFTRIDCNSLLLVV